MASGSDDNAVNHEIATLLLNLASRTQPSESSSMVTSNPKSTPRSVAFNRHEDHSNCPQQQAIDLSSRKTPTLEFPLTIDNANTTGVTSVSPVLQNSTSQSENSVSLGINSNFILQNLLFGKMTQQHPLTISSTTNSPANTLIIPTTSFSTLPVVTQPSQASKLNISTTMKSVFNSLNNSTDNEATTITISSSTTNDNIPLLCGHIVAQLNGLLFLMHDLNSPTLENNLQSSLESIYNRLKEIVSLVEQTKGKHDNSAENGSIRNQSNSYKQNTEDPIKISNDYYKKNILEKSPYIPPKSLPPPLPSQIIPTLKETLPVAAANTVVTMLKKQGVEATIKFNGSPPTVRGCFSKSEPLPEASSSPASSSSEHIEVESSSTSCRRKRGRPPKSISDSLPPGKKQKELPRIDSSTKKYQISLRTFSATSANNKGSKGIRNRVFCGECTGCLTNEDCGKCRYCQDKTKFGGQNRLRQKCLHRRCQMDTHRKQKPLTTNTNNLSQPPPLLKNSLSNENLQPLIIFQEEEEAKEEKEKKKGEETSAIIYSGLDLARIQENNKKSYAQDKVTITNSITKEEIQIKSILVDSTLAETVKIECVATNNNNEDLDKFLVDPEDYENRMTKLSTSRIDKWKAKHKAMLKKVETCETLPKDKDNINPTNISSPKISRLEQSSSVVCIDIKENKDDASSKIPKPISTNQTVLSV